MLDAAWSLRHNLRSADAVYVSLASTLGGYLMSDEHKMLNAPTFPSAVRTLRLPFA